jgi:hypothetical protein
MRVAKNRILITLKPVIIHLGCIQKSYSRVSKNIKRIKSP